MKILACQIEVPEVIAPEARARHVARLCGLVSERLEAAGGADLVVLPELSTISYSRSAFGNIAELAEDLDGPTVGAFADVAKRHGCHVCFGMPRRDGRNFHISQVVVDRRGSVVGHYDKIHIAQFGAAMEKSYFTPGNHLLVFEAGGLRCAPIICYDLRFPELTRTLADIHGVDVILHPVAFARDDTFSSWHHFAITRAIENQVHFLSLNRAGAGYGASLFAQPWIDDDHQPLTFTDGEECRIVEPDMDFQRAARKRLPYGEDRLGDYASLPLRP